MKKWNYLLIMSWILVLTACSDDQQSNPGITGQGNQLQLRLSGLEKMNGQHYEGWAVSTEGVSTTGRFNINDDGDIVAVNVAGDELAVIGSGDTANFALQENPNNLTAFVLTIEPDNDTDPGPSAIHYLEGGFNNGSAMATLQESGAIGASFLNSVGSFILATPTNGPTTHNQGIWYLSSGAPSLTLPTLNNTFTYEGWVVNTATGEVLSTGTFDSASGADSDGAGIAAGPNPAPPFPGQDYITPARFLNNGNYMAVISVEPVPDFDPAPFALKILALPIANGEAVTTDLPMNNISNENDIFIEASVL